MSKRRGFTLIELLVVIAVIALLMAILMPALNRAKKQAKMVVCQAHLKSWGQIWALYCDDNDGYFPFHTLGRNIRGSWIYPLRPHWQTKSDILRCPMATKPPQSARGSNVWGGPSNTYQMAIGGVGDLQEECSYGSNNWTFNSRSGLTEIQGRPTKLNWNTPNVRGGNKAPIFSDTMWKGGGPYDSGIGSEPPQFDGQWLGINYEMLHFCINRHDGFINATFLDWTIRRVGLKELWTLKWHKEFDTAGPMTLAGGVRPEDWPEWMRNFKDY